MAAPATPQPRRGLFSGRGIRKLRRNRLAMAALAVIAFYFALAAASLVGLVSVKDTKARVLPDKMPGLFASPDLEHRVEVVGWFIDRAEQAVEAAERTAARDGDQAARRVLDDAALAERRFVDRPLDELRGLLDTALDALDEMELRLADYEDAGDTLVTGPARIERLRDRPDAADRIAAIEAEMAAAAEARPALQAALAEATAQAEARVLEIMPIPSGAPGVAYFFRTLLGSNNQGKSILLNAVYSTRIAFQVGLVVAIACTIIGTALGAAAAFYGGWVDYVVMYLVSVLSSIPTLVLLGVLVVMFFGNPLFDNPAEKPGLALVPVYCAMGLTFWISTCRAVRGEVLKIKGLEYVQAATTVGFGRLYILMRHVIPNTSHIMFINFALLFIGAIKSEVILSFLGLGVKEQPSWGIMISQGKDDVLGGFFWEVGAASVFMFGLVLAFNILTDALQDAFDPRHVD